MEFYDQELDIKEEIGAETVSPTKTQSKVSKVSEQSANKLNSTAQ